MRPDTVAEAVAEGHHLSKGELLDHEGAQSMAVRMALGETSIIDQVTCVCVRGGGWGGEGVCVWVWVCLRVIVTFADGICARAEPLTSRP